MTDTNTAEPLSWPNRLVLCLCIVFCLIGMYFVVEHAMSWICAALQKTWLRQTMTYIAETPGYTTVTIGDSPSWIVIGATNEADLALKIKRAVAP